MGVRLVAVGIALLVLVGCSESTVVRTSPPGATVSVNGKFVGLTPTVFSVPRGGWRDPYQYKIEMPGYEPVDGNFVVRAAPGRIVGSVFTLGILVAFKRPFTFQGVHDFVLRSEREAVSPSRGMGRRSLPEEKASRTAERSERGLPRFSSCSADQIIDLKNSGLSDGQVRRACEPEAR